MRYVRPVLTGARQGFCSTTGRERYPDSWASPSMADSAPTRTTALTSPPHVLQAVA